jgi:hypothetical protein
MHRAASHRTCECQQHGDSGLAVPRTATAGAIDSVGERRKARQLVDVGFLVLDHHGRMQVLGDLT